MAFTFDPPWALGPMRVKSQATQSGDSSDSWQNIGAAYARYLTNDSIGADASCSWPDLQQYAKRMLRTLTRSKKEAVPGDAEGKCLKVPLRKKQDEEKLIKQLTAAVETENKKAIDFELQVKNPQPDVKALGDADKKNTQLRANGALALSALGRLFAWVYFADAPQEPDLVQMAKSMLKAIPVEDRKSVKGVGTLNLEAILALLAESMLRAYGLRKPISEKNKEVKAVKAMAGSDSDKAMFQIAQNKILTIDILYYWASATLQVKKDIEAARKKILELEKSVKDLKVEMTPLKEADKEAEGLRALVNKLKGRLQNQEADLIQKLNEKAGEEKMAIVQDMMDECSTIMKMIWAALFPNSSYEKYESQFVACTDQYNRKIMEQADDEEDAEDEASDSTFGESDQEGDDKEEEEEADAEEEPP
ncbi:uncharacterized protein LOC110723338 [Chenopodium quinoa]|uniref:uncharacterized protein LOC110723338 n=1 Tax=Chenopodium quinoa TaxID=63459 RepID=UPI000B794190|nr:uncharacterized protein LOC110723338 [Chenopodium quinoa]